MGVRRKYITGPCRYISYEMWDSDGFAWSILECGHAVPSISRRGKTRSSKRFCVLCKKVVSKEDQERKGYLDIAVVEAAVAEGKRRRAVVYFQERRLEVPEELQTPRSTMALYDDPSKIIPV